MGFKKLTTSVKSFMIDTETAVRRYSSFVDILQNRCSQKFRSFHRETLESLFNKVAAPKAQVPNFGEYCKIFKNSFFQRKPLVTASVSFIYASIYSPVLWTLATPTTEKLNFCFKDYFRYEKIHRKFEISSDLLKKSWKGNFSFLQ